MSSSSWKTLKSREIYSNAWIHVREDAVIRPDGGSGIYGVVSMQNPAVFVVALNDNDEVLMVSLYRYATNSMSLEVPAGGSDGQDPLAAAQRELLEETGYTAHDWQQIGQMNALNGVCNAPEYVFLARGLSKANGSAADVDLAQEQHAEGIETVKLVPWGDALTAITDGTINDGETVAALMYAAVSLGRVG